MSLVREPENPVDKRAIAAVDAQNRLLGYIPASIAKSLAGEMDRGKRVTASVEEIRRPTAKHPSPNAVLTIEIYKKR